MHLDQRGHLRHIFYPDAGESFGQELPCFDHDDGDVSYYENEKKAIELMFKFWEKVWARRSQWGEPKRLQILQKVLDRLESLTLSPFFSPFHKCLANLQMCVKRQTIVFFFQ